MAMQRFWWILGLAVSYTPAQSWAQNVPEGTAPAATAQSLPRATSSAALAATQSEFEDERPPRRLRRNSRQFGEVLGVGFGTHALGSKDRHDLALSGVRFGQVLDHRG